MSNLSTDAKCKFDDGNIITHVEGLYEHLRTLNAKIDALTKLVERIETSLDARK